MRAGDVHRSRRSLASIVLLLAILMPACTPTTLVKRTPTPTSTPIPPSSQALIIAAVEAGSISYDTSLLYRAYALFGDPRLPQQFQGSGSVNEDPVLFAAATDPANTLAPDIQAALHPFIVRPTAPDSYFHQLAGTTALAGPAARLAPTDGAAHPRDTACAAGWVTQDAPNPAQVKVWAEAGSDPQTAKQDVAAVAQMIGGLWGPMASLMGTPLPDDPDPAICNPDSRIDIYLVTPGQRPPRGAGATELGGNGEAWAVTQRDTALPSSKSPPLGTSSYIDIDRTLLHHDPSPSERGRDLFRASLVHEFFHVLENSHYGKHTCVSTACFWFAEASAVWAESYFARDLAPTTAYRRFSNVFQGCDPASNSSQPLNLSNDPASGNGDHMYAAFIWPYFLQQQPDGGPQRVAAIWKSLEAATTWKDLKPEDTWDGADKLVIDQQDLHTFGVRNLNLALRPGNPIAPRYVGLDAKFPDNTLPGEVDPPQGSDVADVQSMNVNGQSYACKKHSATLAESQVYTTGVDIQPLSARYYYFNVKDSARQVTFDFSGLLPSANLEIDALVNIKKQGWKLLNLTGTGTKRFCRLTPGEDLTEIYLVLTNKDFKQKISGQLLAHPRTQNCSCDTIQAVQKGWVGTIGVTYDANLSGNGQSATFHRAADVTVRFDQWETPNGSMPTAGWGPGGATLIGQITGGTAGVHDVVKDGSSLVTDFSGHGPPFFSDPNVSSTERSHGWLYWHSATCSYILGLTLGVNTVGTPNDNSGSITLPYYIIINVDTGEIASGGDPHLTGSLPVPVHGPDGAQGVDPVFLNVNSLDASYGSNQGAAQLTWSLEPLDPPSSSTP